MSRVGRRPTLRWLLRFALLLGASELSLWGAAYVLEHVQAAARATTPAYNRIVCVGDSNTYGIGAPSGRSYPDQLRELLAPNNPEVDVVNLGVAGFTSPQILSCLEDALADGAPRCVIFCGGMNDYARADQLLRLDSFGPLATVTVATRLHALATGLRTFRVLEAAVKVLRGDIADEAFGGSKRSASVQSPWPASLTPAEWDEATEKYRHEDLPTRFEWMSRTWESCTTRGIRILWDEFMTQPAFAQARTQLRFPPSDYGWEAAMLAGEPAPPLDPAGRTEKALAFARYTKVQAALAAGDTAAARAALQELGNFMGDSWSLAFVDLLKGWVPLLERDFARADDQLDAALVKTDALSPLVAIEHAIGGSVLAHVLRDDQTRLAEWLDRHGTTWKQHYLAAACPDGHEWMAAALWIDRIKGGDAKAVEMDERIIRQRFGATPSSGPLRWLYAHPKASFSDVRAHLELGPPRATWLGPRHMFFRQMSADELDRLLKPVIDRLDLLARDRGFKMVMGTYLNYESTTAMVNQKFRAIAADHRWPLIDPHQHYTDAELGADDKTRYFSADRGHPNERGYAIVAQAAREILVANGIVK